MISFSLISFCVQGNHFVWNLFAFVALCNCNNPNFSSENTLEPCSSAMKRVMVESQSPVSSCLHQLSKLTAFSCTLNMNLLTYCQILIFDLKKKKKNYSKEYGPKFSYQRKPIAIYQHLSTDLIQLNITNSIASAAWRSKLLFQEIYPFTILLQVYKHVCFFHSKC